MPVKDKSSGNPVDESPYCDVVFRRPTVTDAHEIWNLVAAGGVLELNSLYCYLLMCRDFSDSSLVAYRGRDLAAFVIGYRPPTRLDTQFVWQVGVSPHFRRRGLGLRVLQELVTRGLKDPAEASGANPGSESQESGHLAGQCRYLESTVTPSNEASQRLFKAVAESGGASCQISEGFGRELFGAEAHEEELLFRIGPFPDNPFSVD